MREPVTLRLDVDMMKYQMIQAIAQRSAEVEQAINTACDNFVQSGELQRQIDRAFADCVQKEIAAYFSYGEGNKVIQEAVRAGFREKGKEK